jgi:hypothetical protein
MSYVVNKTTMEYRESVHTPDYSEEEWWINPNRNFIETVPQKYWRNNNGNLAEMTTTQKNAVDLARQDAIKVGQAEQVIQQKIRELGIQKGVDDGVLNADGSLK